MSDPDNGWRILNWVWERKDEIAKKLALIYNWFRGGKEPDANRGILIIGPGGTGKTTLARILSGEFDWLTDSPWVYQESLDTEHLSLSDDPTVEIVIPPGQPHRRDFAWPDILRNLASGAYRGVIVTACAGYHTFATPSYRGHPLYEGDKDEFFRKYVADRREEEARVFGQLVPHLAICPGKIWLLVVVAKQDLWGSQQGEVERYYAEGSVYKEIADIAHKLGSQRFRSEVVFTSLVIANLMTRAGERLKANEEGYDSRRQIESLRHLLEIVDALRQWEAQ